MKKGSNVHVSTVRNTVHSSPRFVILLHAGLAIATKAKSTPIIHPSGLLLLNSPRQPHVLIRASAVWSLGRSRICEDDDLVPQRVY